MNKKIVLIIVFIINIAISLFSQNTNFKKAKRLTYKNSNFQLVAKDTTLLIEIIKITKTNGIEIIKKKNRIVKKKKNVYIVQCSSEDNIGRTIISLSSDLKGLSKIKIGEKYKLFLIPYFDEDCMPGDGLETINIDNIVISNVRIQGVNVYFSPNLSGLYYKPNVSDL